jgi:hypothetical protein
LSPASLRLAHPITVEPGQHATDLAALHQGNQMQPYETSQERTRLGERRARGLLVGMLVAVLAIAAALFFGDGWFVTGHERSSISPAGEHGASVDPLGGLDLPTVATPTSGTLHRTKENPDGKAKG